MTDDDLLYHYTGGSALTSIIASECLWASDPLFLNDAEELRAGKERLIESIRPALSSIAGRAGGGESKIESLYAGFQVGAIKDVTQFIEAVDTYCSDVAHVYVTCFCEDGDLLSQLRS